MLHIAEGSVIAQRYVLSHLLGRGGMGMVFLAYDRQLSRRVAIKIIVPGRTPPDASDIHRFQLEAVALASISSRHVVALHTFGRAANTSYFTMDYVEGATVERIIARTRIPLSLDFVVSTMRDVGRGLEHVHRAGFIHRDVKPSNILVERHSGRAILFDLGLAFPWRAVGAIGADPGAGNDGGVGSPPYMAPEQSGCAFEPGSDEIGPWTDEYALACTGFEMLAGRPPFEGECIGELLRKHMLSRPPRLSCFRSELASLDHVFIRALAKAPAERYGSATEMVRALTIAGAQGTHGRAGHGLLARVRSIFPDLGLRQPGREHDGRSPLLTRAWGQRGFRLFGPRWSQR